MKKSSLVLALLSGVIIGAVGVSRIMGRQIKEKQNMSYKHLVLFEMMNRWVRIKQESKNLASYLESKGCQKIAIYGMSYVGETLIEEFKGTNIKVVYGIDQNADSIYSAIDVLSADEELPKVDAVIVTAITFYDEIKEKISKKLDCPIISLEDILYVL